MFGLKNVHKFPEGESNAKCAFVTHTPDEFSGVVSGFGCGIRRRFRLLLSTFEAWLRESGHLEILDKCNLDQGRPQRRNSLSNSVKALRINPFKSLTVEDCCKGPVSWTGEFLDCGLGPKETYSLPRSLTQAKLRMEENIKRYTGNYLVLAMVVVLCYLYKIPVALLGIMSILALWDTVRVYLNTRGLTQTSLRFRALQILGNLGTVFIMIYCKVAVALAWACLTSLIVVVGHSMLRRITVTKHPPKPAVMKLQIKPAELRT
ncbi:hypothetical protein R1sor_013076 [Riccia sorocarpa]|uniref:PRA1 family protein n=1 Tax=Riccia sorocarpa TaxID=122646 RepID=A0ABD3H874_9MARC